MLESTISIGAELRSAYDTEEIAVYTPSWVVFAPDLIVEARLGIFTRVLLDVAEAHRYINDKASCLRSMRVRLKMAIADQAPQLYSKALLVWRHVSCTLLRRLKWC